MDQLKKDFLIIAAILGLIGTSALVLSLNRAVHIPVQIPEDVAHKLNAKLIRNIQNGDWISTHESFILCNSTAGMFSVIDALPSDTVEDYWEMVPTIQAFLTPEQIFSVARMDEVIQIDGASMASIGLPH